MRGLRATVHARTLGPLLLLLFHAQAAEAHAQPGEGVSFLSGLKHPISGLDHVVAMVAVGLWGAQLGVPAIWMLPVAFPLVMAFGGMLGLLGVPLPGTEFGIAASALLLGAAVMTRLRPPPWAAAALVGLFAIFHGYAHGSELPPGANGLLYSLGFVMATGCLHAAGIALGLLNRSDLGGHAVRLFGALIALTGVYFLTRAMLA